MKKNSQVSDVESPFAYSELFYSKTDRRGVILSGNSVFRRVSEYEWAEILEKPHSLIRHPDMPRGVFCLFWEFLKAGRPIGAFVKNRSKTGKYYWVFALALPVADGFLSVRLKPGGDLLQTIEGEYRQLRDLERTQNLTPEDSADRLRHRLAELGFANYESFMSHALVDQILNRDRELRKSDHSDVGQLLQMKDLSHGIVQDTGQILKAFSSSQYVPLNLEVYASKLGAEGRQVSVVAS